MSGNPITPSKKFPTPSKVFLSKFEDLKKFFRTRSSILNGEPLYNLDNQELAARQLMGPWSFKVAQSILGTLGPRTRYVTFESPKDIP